MPRVKEIIEKTLVDQKDNLVLWMPVAFGCGIGAYFGLKAEPAAFVTGSAFALMAALWLLVWPLRERNFPVWLAATGLFLFTAGFAAAQLRAALLDTVMLEKPGTALVAGAIAGIDALEPGEGIRVVLEDLIIEDVPPEKTPEKVRLRIRNDSGLHVGDRISVLARLNPPSAPVEPHAFDFQRYAYFSRIGAFGFAYKDPVVEIAAEKPPLRQTPENLRRAIRERIEQHVPFPEAAIVAALITGEMTAVSEEDWEAFRISGLAHMLSISGMHIGLVATVFFFTSRLLMATFPAFALRHPIKKYAAVIALAGALFYTVLAGAPVPTVRATIMTGIVLIAVLLDRTPFSIRTVALAAMAVLIFWPEALWGASFQMSFAAITALIVVYDVMKPRLSGWYKGAGFIRRLALYFAGVCATTFIASLAVDPFSLYHFQQVGLYSIPANVATAPVMAFAVMPFAVLACLLMPLGLEEWPLHVMAKGVSFVLSVAHETASWPEAAIKIHALPLSVLLCVVAGAFILLFWRGRGKAAALLPFMAAFIFAFSYRPPDILVSADAKLIALRDERGDYQLSPRAADKFTAENWLRRNGQDIDIIPRWPEEGEGPQGLQCGEGGCRTERSGQKVAFSFSPVTHREDCNWASVLIAQDPVRIRPCRAALVIDRFSVWREGAHALWLDGRVETVQSSRGQRPWTVSNRR